MEIVEKRNPLPWLLCVVLLVCVISLGVMLHQTQAALEEAEFNILRLEDDVEHYKQEIASLPHPTLNEMVEAQEAREAEEAEEESNLNWEQFMRKHGRNPDGTPINPNEGMDGTPYAERNYGTPR